MFKVLKQFLCFVLILGLVFGGLVGFAPKPSYALASHPIISEMIDASKGEGSPKRYDRYVEVYNPTNQDIDLTGYKVVLVENNVEKNTVDLSGTLVSGDAIVVSQNQDKPYIDFKDSKDHWSSFNGKGGDGAILKHNDSVVDHAVSSTSFENKRIERNFTIGSPNATFTDAEWTVKACSTVADATPGAHESQYPESTTKVAKVLVTPESGKSFDFNEGNVTVTLSTTTEDAKIYYGVIHHPTDKSAPDSYELYSAPISLSQAADIYTYATKDGMTNSDTVKVTYYGLDVANIADVRNATGRVVKVVGTVTGKVGSNSIYIQDATAGIILSEYKSGALSVNVGDKVEVVGPIAQFYGNAQIQPAKTSDVKVVQAGAGVPNAKVVTANQVNESVEGQLVTIKNVSLAAKDAKGNVVLTDATGDVKMLFSGDFYPQENHESITGVVNYHFNEYKILPREASDLIQDSSKTDRPKANIPSGDIETGTKITLSSKTSGAEIYYVVGADSSSVALNYGEGTLYSEAITINDENKYIKAYAKSDSLTDSVMVEFTYTLADVTKIHDIQGASHTSPLVDQQVTGVKGVVTAVSNDRFIKGFFMQEPDASQDNDPKTSEGIFVATTSKFAVGDYVTVNGTVIEKKNDKWDNTLKESQIQAASVTKLGSGFDLPTPIVLGENGRPVITDIVDNDSFADFDPSQDAIDYYEAVEGMLIKVEQPAIVGGDERYGEIYILADNGKASASKRSYRGGIILTEGNTNPEIMTVDDVLVPITNASTRQFSDHGFTPNPGDRFDGDITGVMSYGFGKYKIYNTSALPTVIDNPVASEKPVTTVVGDGDTVTVASFNVENFSKDKGQDKADAIANAVVTNMKNPDIIALIEVQDNDGDTESDVVDGSESYQFLIDRIKVASKAAGSEVTYAFTDIAPVNKTDGGIPGGNIRVGYLYNPERVSLAAGEKGGSTEAVTVLDNGHLSKNPGRVDPQSEHFNSTRKSLVAEFEFKGKALFVITNHLSSKRGDAPTFGDIQPVVRKSEENRHKQAQVINDFVDGMKAKNPEAAVVVLGDMNDFHFSETLKLIAGKGDEQVLVNPISLMPQNKQFTYNYGGSSQVLDNILVTKNINYVCEPLSINAGFYHSQGRASDHDPVMLGVTFGDVKEVLTIADAKAKANDEEVTIEAVVQNLQGGFGQESFTVQDSTGAMYIFTNTDHNLAVGDKVSLTGAVAEYKGAKQIKNPTVKVIGKNVALNKKLVTTVGEDVESHLVTINKGVVKSVTTGSFNNVEIILTLDGNDINVKLDSRTGYGLNDISSVVTTDAKISVTGIVLQSDDQYIINLRTPSDVGPYVVPTITIAEARALPTGSEVATEGIVVNKPGVFGGTSFAFYDKSAGLYVYTNKALPEGVDVGTKIKITGTTKAFNGLKQIDPTKIEVLSQGNELTYVDVTNKLVLANCESMVVVVRNAIVKEIIDDGKFHNGKVIVTLNGEDIICKLDSRSGDNYTTLAEKIAVGDEVEIKGVVTNYKGNYSIKLRNASDVAKGKPVSLTDANITNIAGQSLDRVTKNDMIFISPSLNYTEENALTGLLMIKIENKHNEMVRVGMVRSFTVSKEASTSASLGFDLSGLPKGEYKIKMFLWNNWNEKVEFASPFEKVLTIN